MDWTIVSSTMTPGLVALIAVLSLGWLYRIDKAVTILQIQVANVIDALQEREAANGRRPLHIRGEIPKS